MSLMKPDGWYRKVIKVVTAPIWVPLWGLSELLQRWKHAVEHETKDKGEKS